MPSAVPSESPSVSQEPSCAPTAVPSEAPTFLTTCDTAYILCNTGSYCFVSDPIFDFNGDGDADFRRWGWSNEILEDKQCTIYAGAADCDPNKGYVAGYVFFDVSEGTATLELADGVVLTELQVYAGAEILPRGPNGKFTVSPGQYPISASYAPFVGNSLTVDGISALGDGFVVFHAVTCQSSTG